MDSNSFADTFSVLLVGSADLRHVLRTVATCTGSTSKQIHVCHSLQHTSCAQHLALILCMMCYTLSKPSLSQVMFMQL